MNYNEIKIGDEVSWTDKGHNDWEVKEGLAENIYKVEVIFLDLGQDTILLISRDNIEFEVFLHELF